MYITVYYNTCYYNHINVNTCRKQSGSSFIGVIEHDSALHDFNTVLDGRMQDYTSFSTFSILHHAIQPGEIFDQLYVVSTHW